MSKKKPIIMSIHPEYATMIFSGDKKFELRKSFNTRSIPNDVFIYVTSPVREIRGGFSVIDCSVGSLDSFWHDISENVGICIDDAKNYCSKTKVVYALHIGEVWRFRQSVKLSEVSGFAHWQPPQSWRYATAREQKYLSTREHITGLAELRSVNLRDYGRLRNGSAFFM